MALKSNIVAVLTCGLKPFKDFWIPENWTDIIDSQPGFRSKVVYASEYLNITHQSCMPGIGVHLSLHLQKSLLIVKAILTERSLGVSALDM